MALFGTRIGSNEHVSVSEVIPPDNILVQHDDLKSEEFDVQATSLRVELCLRDELFHR